MAGSQQQIQHREVAVAIELGQLQCLSEDPIFQSSRDDRPLEASYPGVLEGYAVRLLKRHCKCMKYMKTTRISEGEPSCED